MPRNTSPDSLNNEFALLPQGVGLEALETPPAADEPTWVELALPHQHVSGEKRLHLEVCCDAVLLETEPLRERPAPTLDWKALLERLAALQYLFIETYPVTRWPEARPSQGLLSAEVSFCQNPWIEALNRNYRQKPVPTDVLTFPLAIPDSLLETPFSSLPETQMEALTSLGSVVVSLDWARQHCNNSAPLALERFLLERVIHGLLHLSGQHHETEADYQTVISLQNTLLERLFAVHAPEINAVFSSMSLPSEYFTPQAEAPQSSCVPWNGVS